MYLIKPVEQPPLLTSKNRDSSWDVADIVHIAEFHENSESRHPRVEARVVYDADALYLRFDVADQYVRSVRTNYQDGVCRDSCVEFFVQPKVDAGYFNFEVNAGGTMLLYYITDCSPGEQGFKAYEKVPAELVRDVEIISSLPKVIEPEIQEPVAWSISMRIPKALFEAFVGPLDNLSGQTWRANFYKCADDTSHPHWISWKPVGNPLSFHKPECFGAISFN